MSRTMIKQSVLIPIKYVIYSEFVYTNNTRTHTHAPSDTRMYIRSTRTYTNAKRRREHNQKHNHPAENKTTRITEIHLQHTSLLH